MLTSEELLGLQIVALHRADMLDGANCEGCNRQEAWNCGCEATEEPVFHSPTFEFYLTACPLQYVPETVWEFIDRYTYYEINQDSTPYEKAQNKYWNAVKAFRSFSSRVESDKMQNREPSDKGLANARRVKGLA